MQRVIALAFLCLASASEAACTNTKREEDTPTYLACRLEEAEAKIANLEKTVRMVGEAVLSTGRNVSALQEENKVLKYRLDEAEKDIRQMAIRPNPYP